MILKIFPEPKDLTLTREGEAKFPLLVNTSCEEWESTIDVFSSAFLKIHGAELKKGDGGILLLISPDVRSDGYKIEVDDTIRILASTREGVLYGLATVLQLVTVKDGMICSPVAQICDYPDKEFRGLMLDLVGKYHTLKNLLQFVDICFFYKVKYLHLHIMGNTAYRLPSKAFPRLSAAMTCYSEEELAQLNAYAEARGVTLIPELEIPGHATIMTRVYPEIFKNRLDGSTKLLTTENGDVLNSDSIICAGSQAANDALRTMLDEICELFPHTPYIHIGGDEADSAVWDFCPVCKSYIKEHGLKDSDDLYVEFTARIAQMVLDKGRTPIVWEGFPKESIPRIPRETIVIAWESHYHQAQDLLDEGFRIINASWQPLYIVPSLVRRWYAKDILQWDVYNLQHWWEGSAACYNPIHLPPTDRLLGAQICSWGCSFAQEAGLVLENLAALSERCWNVQRRSDLTQMLENMEPLLNAASRLINE